MRASLKEMAKAVTPPIVWRALSAARYPATAPAQAPAQQPVPAAPFHGHHGDFESYDAARTTCKDDYSNPAVLEKTRVLTQDIRRSQLISPLNIRLLAALQYAIARTEGEISILDHGGAMGGHYFYLKDYLPPIAKWTVVELEDTVEVANRHFADGVLRFTAQPEPASIIISSGALQFMRAPHDALDQLLNLRPGYLILDKMPLYERDRIVVHDIHPALFGSSVAFPLHLIDDTRVRARLARHRVVFEWELPNYAVNLEGTLLDMHRGFLVEL